MIERKHFDRKILIIGYGAVSRCAFPLFLKHLDVPIENITIIDQEDKAREIAKTKTSVNFKQISISRENLDAVLEEFVGDNGLVIDLAWNIGTKDLIKWCHDHNTLYVNTSVEVWDPYSETDARKKTLYHRQMELRRLTAGWSSDSVTAVLDHGANPGLISHFTKKGLIDIAKMLLSKGMLKGESKEKIARYVSTRDFARLAYALGVKVIHCSERDTQVSRRIKGPGEFINTWSGEGFVEEGMATVEMGWGTHELTYPPNYLEHQEGPKNQIALARMGINTWHRSYVPVVGEITGMIVRHGEAFGISDRLTVRDKDGKVIYRPTVHYVYRPCDDTLLSLDEFRAGGYNHPSRIRIMCKEIAFGKDSVGALIMGHALNSWWTGTILDIKEARKKAPGQNATTLQVAAGILSAVMWTIDNPKRGVCLPDDLPHDYILDIAAPYLGELHSRPYNWTPLKNRKVFFPENPAHKINTKDPWQFRCFVPLP